MAPRTPWSPNFPPIIAQTGYQAMREHVAYRAAKDGASGVAAFPLVIDCLSDESMDAIERLINGREIRIASVHAEELTGRNRIPITYGTVLATVFNVPHDVGIIQTSFANHGGSQSIYHRLVSEPIFGGNVGNGVNYVIIDDTCAAGGTLANFKGFIESNGGIVIGMSVLALKQHPLRYEISLTENTLGRLRYRHRTLDALWREEFGNGIDTLTEGEAGHLLKAPSVDAIRDRLASARRDLGIGGG
jgi:hypothetical protein